jgi:hypothetical protein
VISLGKNTARKLAERRNERDEDQIENSRRAGNHADPRLKNGSGKTVNKQTLALGGGGQLEVTWWVD